MNLYHADYSKYQKAYDAYYAELHDYYRGRGYGSEEADERAAYALTITSQKARGLR